MLDYLQNNAIAIIGGAYSVAVVIGGYAIRLHIKIHDCEKEIAIMKKEIADHKENIVKTIDLLFIKIDNQSEVINRIGNTLSKIEGYMEGLKQNDNRKIN